MTDLDPSDQGDFFLRHLGEDGSVYAMQPPQPPRISVLHW